MKILVYLLFVLAGSCNNTDLQNRQSGTDTTMKSIDSSAMINENSRLPRDSTATGVQH